LNPERKLAIMLDFLSGFSSHPQVVVVVVVVVGDQGPEPRLRLHCSH
jgi:hypothetical protein